jgi:hypothetical protein
MILRIQDHDHYIYHQWEDLTDEQILNFLGNLDSQPMDFGMETRHDYETLWTWMMEHAPNNMPSVYQMPRT